MKSLENNKNKITKSETEILNIFLSKDENKIETLTFAEIGQFPSWLCFYCNKDLENEVRTNYQLYRIEYKIFQYTGNRYYNLKENKVELVCHNQTCQTKLSQKSPNNCNGEMTVFNVKKIELE